MVKRLGGARRKSRYKLRKNVSDKGKTSLRGYFQKLNVNDKVALVMEPGVQSMAYNLRFHGKIGRVTGQKGSCYNIKIMDGKKEKDLIVHPIHLRRV